MLHMFNGNIIADPQVVCELVRALLVCTYDCESMSLPTTLMKPLREELMVPI